MAELLELGEDAVGVESAGFVGFEFDGDGLWVCADDLVVLSDDDDDLPLTINRIHLQNILLSILQLLHPRLQPYRNVAHPFFFLRLQ